MGVNSNDFIVKTCKGFCIVQQSHPTQKYFHKFTGEGNETSAVLAIMIRVRDDFEGKDKYHVFQTSASREVRPKIIYVDKKGSYIKFKRSRYIPELNRHKDITEKHYLSKDLEDKARDFIRGW